MSRILLTISILLMPAAVFAAAPHTFQELADDIADILESLTALLVLAGVAVYFYGISTNLLKIGEMEKEKVRDYFFWGIIVLFVMVSIWGILHLLQDTLFGSSPFNATNGGPQSSFQSPQFFQ